MKKTIIRTLSLSAVSIGSLVSMTACGVTAAKYTPGTPVKVGLICLHDSNSTYDANFINALEEAVGNLGNRVSFEKAQLLTGINEDEACYNAAKDLVKKGCNLIFADSFGHQDFMLQAAKEWPDVQFCHATGTNAKTAKLANYHNAFASIYEGRYLAGFAAGLKLTTLKTAEEFAQGATVGYVGAFPYAEVKSGYTSWFLGVREALRQYNYDETKLQMNVQFTNSWYDVNAEASAAASLINGGAILVSQHADSMGAPGECESKNIPNVTYNIETKKDCPKTYLAYSRINWAPYYEAVVNAMYEGKAIEGESNNNWTGTLGTGSVEYNVNWDNLGRNELEKAGFKLAFAAEAALIASGTKKVFDTAKFTVGGKKVESYKADTDGDFKGDTEVIVNGTGVAPSYFDESHYCSAPYFDLDIDGINLPTK